MQIFMYILLGFLVVCAISVSLSKNLLNSVLIYMSYSLVMSVIWILLESPDLAITEAAVGAGITSLLFFVTLKKIHAMVKADDMETANDAVGVRADAAAQNDTETARADVKAVNDAAGVQADAAARNDAKTAQADAAAANDAAGAQADNSGEGEQKHE